MKTYLLNVILLLSLALIIGCAPSIRYTRSEDGQVHYMVPRDWDYRKTYKIPADRLESVIRTYIGTPYRFAGMNRKGVDCSGFVCLVFKELNNVDLPHSSKKMSRYGREISLGQTKSGDLVFFKGGIFGSINHVGIMVGAKKFAHASSKKGVTYSSLDEDYFKKRFVMVRRIF